MLMKCPNCDFLGDVKEYQVLCCYGEGDYLKVKCLECLCEFEAINEYFRRREASGGGLLGWCFHDT